MEPVTMTLVAAVTIAAASTHRPKWESYFDAHQHSTTMVLPKREVTTIPLVDRRAPVTSQNTIAVPKDRLFQELMAYLPAGDEDPSAEPVSKIEDILAANDFLQKLPGSIPLPTLQRNHAGQIGMYWDNDLFYIDVDIDSGSTVSLYGRNQATTDQFIIEDIQIEQIDGGWFEEHIGQMLKPNAVVA